MMAVLLAAVAAALLYAACRRLGMGRAMAASGALLAGLLLALAVQRRDHS